MSKVAAVACGMALAAGLYALMMDPLRPHRRRQTAGDYEAWRFYVGNVGKQ